MSESYKIVAVSGVTVMLDLLSPLAAFCSCVYMNACID